MRIKEFLRPSDPDLDRVDVEMTAVCMEDHPTKRKVWSYSENSDADQSGKLYYDAKTAKTAGFEARAPVLGCVIRKVEKQWLFTPRRWPRRASPHDNAAPARWAALNE
jgi:hypothetical protein